jgi:hypothetical protein
LFRQRKVGRTKGALNTQLCPLRPRADRHQAAFPSGSRRFIDATSVRRQIRAHASGPARIEDRGAMN